MAEEYHVMLAVKEGRGFPNTHQPFVVEAGLNGVLLLTDPVAASQAPTFGTDLIWEVDKNDLKRLRMSMIPIRVECFITNAGERRERIGYILLNLRSAQKVTEGQEIAHKWHELLGVKSTWRKSKPELNMSLRIQPASLTNIDAQNVRKEASHEAVQLEPPIVSAIDLSPVSAEDIVVHEDKRTSDAFHEGKRISEGPPVRSEINVCPPRKRDDPQFWDSDGCYHLGSNIDGTDTFVLKIWLGNGANLDMLIPPDRRKDNNNFYLSFQILGSQTNTSTCKSLNQFFDSEETKVFHICSSLEDLRSYFRKENLVKLCMFNKEKLLGLSHIDLRALVEGEELECGDMSVKVCQCRFMCPDTQEVPTDEMGRKPYVNVSLKLKKSSESSRNVHDASPLPQESVPSKPLPQETALSKQRSEETVKKDVKESLRDVSSNNMMSYNASKEMLDTIVEKRAVENKRPKSTVDLCGGDDATLGILQFSPPLPLQAQDTSPAGDKQKVQPTLEYIETFKVYDVTVTLESVNLRSVPPSNKGTFRFQHANLEVTSVSQGSEITFAPDSTTLLANVHSMINLVTAPDQMALVFRQSPLYVKLVTQDGGYIITFAEAVVDLSVLLNREKKIVQKPSGPIEVQECACTVPLYTCDGMNVGSLTLNMSLHHRGPIPARQIPVALARALTQSDGKSQSGVQAETIFDERRAYRVVEELEEWKERQEKIFLEELQKKENARLECLAAEWKKQRSVTEASLREELARCQELTVSLDEATGQLRESSQQLADKERMLFTIKDELEREYQKRFQELREASVRLEEDLRHELESVKKELTEKETYLHDAQEEVDRLKELSHHQEKTLQHEEKQNKSNGEKVTELHREIKSLEQKLEVAQKAKSFFKQQWAKVVREVHRMKLQYQLITHGQQANISRQEQYSAGLRDELHEAERQLQGDHGLLQEIRNELLKLQEMEWGDQKNAKVRSPRPQQQQQPSIQLRIQASPQQQQAMAMATAEMRLKQLLTEKMTLLQTGSYSPYDPIIQALDQEIRALSYPH